MQSQLVTDVLNIAEHLDHNQDAQNMCVKAAAQIIALENALKIKSEQLIDADWRLNPDRMGGQIDPRELRRDEWGNYR